MMLDFVAYCLTEDDSLVVVGEHLALDVLLDCTGEDYLLQVLALEYEGLGGVLVGDAYHVLFDDGACIQFGGHVVTGGTDNLHSSLVCLMIWLGADEGWQEGVVDIDDAVWERLDHVLGDYLHVARQDDEVDILLLHELHLCLFHFLLVRPVLLDGPHVIRYVKLLCHVAQVFVVADDAGDVALQFACLVSCKEVVEAVAHLADEECHAWALVTEVEFELHIIALAVECLDIFLYLLIGDGEALGGPFHSHEEAVVHGVHILVEIYDVTVVGGDESCHLRYDALLVGAV